MAFCGKCGTQLSEGAKFCSRCGHPVSSNDPVIGNEPISGKEPVIDKEPVSGNKPNNVQDPIINDSFEEEPEEEQIKTWQKIFSVLFWPAGVVLIIIALIKKQSELAKSALIYTAIGIGLAIGLNAALDGCSNDVGDPVEETSEGYYQEEVSDVEKTGYEDGYEQGFSLGGEMIDNVVRMFYTNRYGAPTTAEERMQFKNYQNAFMRGFRDGKNARQ